MENISVVIIDDEKEAREGVEILLQKTKEIEIKALCKNGLEAIKAIQEHKPELIFLDIQMPAINGFEVLNTLSNEILPEVIFVTAYDQYSLEAFEKHAVDYLLKPFTDTRFFAALEHAKRRIYEKRKSNQYQKVKQLLEDYEKNLEAKGEQKLINEQQDDKNIVNNRLVIKADGKIYFVPLNDIIWVQAYDYYVKIHIKSRFYLIRESLKKMEQILPNNRFIRVHKSSIINIDHIVEMEPHFNNEFMAKMSNGEAIKTSRSFRDNLKGIM